MTTFNGLGVHLGNLSRLSPAQTRSISPENLRGEKGHGGMAVDGTGADAARDLGQGWKISPSIPIASGEVREIADISGPGAIQQIWLTPTGHWRHLILRMYWDGAEQPAVECPVGDFFAAGWQSFAQVSSLAVCVNPGNGFNCYWEMPFRTHCRITVENIAAAESVLYYQISYALTEVPADAAYFHAQFRRSNPLPTGDVHTILDGVRGQGHYVGTYVAWGATTDGWWGEGELKFFLDGDREFPTICGTGVEDYFGGSYSFQHDGNYRTFTTPYVGMPLVIQADPDDPAKSPTRIGMYRWHLTDPIRFGTDLRVTMQSIGWAEDGRYRLIEDDISSVAFWYQTLPTAPFPTLPGADALAVS